MMYLATIEFGTPAFDQAIRLREHLLRKPLGKTLNIRGVRHEFKQETLGAFDERDQLLGVVLLKPRNGTTVQLRQMAVTESMQGRGIGKNLVHAALNHSRSDGFEKIRCEARREAIPFYEKLEFEKRGEGYEKFGIEHRLMERFLERNG